MTNVINRVLEKVGGPSALSRLLNIRPQAVSQWRRVPVERVLEIERVTGITRHELRPDIYPLHDGLGMIPLSIPSTQESGAK